jgi:hypothetical protein
MSVSSEKWFNSIFNAVSTQYDASSLAYVVVKLNNRLYEEGKFCKLYVQNETPYLIVFPRNDMRNKMSHYNGVIFARTDTKWVQVCNPVMQHAEVIPHEDKKILSKRIAEGSATVWSAYLGPVINIWYYDGLWNIGTKKGINMFDVAINEMTYGEMIDDAVGWTKLTSTLDTELTYSFVLEHGNVNPIIATNVMVFLRAAKSAGELGVEEIIDFEELLSIPGVIEMKYHPEFTEPRPLFTIFSNAKNALKNYVNGRKKIQNFGYVISDQDKSYLIKSSLQSYVTSIFAEKELYNLVITHNYHLFTAGVILHYLRCLSSITSASDRYDIKIFREVFPQFIKFTDTLDRVIDAVVDAIAIAQSASISWTTVNTVGPVVGSGSQFDISDIVEHISEKPVFNSPEFRTYKKIRQVAQLPDHFHLYYQVMIQYSVGSGGLIKSEEPEEDEVRSS